MNILTKPAVRSRDTPARRELISRLLNLARTHHERLERRVAELGLSLPQAKALYHIDASQSMRVLARTLHCDASNITVIIDALEQQRLVERQVDPSDRRVRRLVLTAKGRRMRERVADAMFDIPELDLLSPQDEQVLQRLFERLATPT